MSLLDDILENWAIFVIESADKEIFEDEDLYYPDISNSEGFSQLKSALIYYTTVYKDGKMYNLEVLYDAKTNTAYHFKYSRKAMGNLPAKKVIEKYVFFNFWAAKTVVWRITMTKQEQLWYLIVGILEGSYNINTFCSEFERIYNLEIDYNELTDKENDQFSDLCEMAERFSDKEDELNIPNMYFSEEDIINKVKEIKKLKTES